MKLNKDNYESWALDYIEGMLSAEDRAAFEVFLAGQPDIAREVRSLQGGMPALPVERYIYPDKRSLLRGGRTLTLSRVGSFLGGMAAASLLIGLFLLVDRHDSSHDDALLGEQFSVRSEDAFAEESSEDMRESAGTDSEQLAERTSAAVRPQLASAGPVRLSAPVRNVRPAGRITADPIAPVLAGHAAQAEFRGEGTAPLTYDPAVASITVVVSALGDDTHAAAPISFRESSRRETPAETDFQAGSSSEITSGRRALASILAPLDYIIPIKTYRTEDESGVEIISLIRIGNKNTKNNH